jgi:sodium-dependent dicarboxylate transporter 2/3/5
MAPTREPLTGHKARMFGFFLGPMLGLLLFMMPAPQELTGATWHTAAVAVWMVVWWISEAAPLAATALLPVVFFPVFGVMTLKDTLVPYANPVVFLFLGGFILAAAMQKTGLHRRIALWIVRLVGMRPDRLVLGFMTATAFLSLWVSATVAVAMMLPMALSLIDLVQREQERPQKSAQNFTTCLMLGITYAASIGGMGTLIGAPSNAFVKGFFSNNYGIEISFLDWMEVGVPVVFTLILAMWLVLAKIVFRFESIGKRATAAVIEAAMQEQGPFSRPEKIVGCVFVLTVIAWVAQGWLASRLPGITETGIALAGATALFLIPVNFEENRFVLTWKDAERIPWDVLVLIGGGLTMAGGLETTGLAQWIGTGIASVTAGLPHGVLLALIILAVAVTTEFMSNIATTTLWVPIVAPLAIGVGENPLLFVVPAALAASCAFVLPVSTANNALVYGTGQFEKRDMIRAGLILDIIAVVVLVALSYALMEYAMQVQPGILPDWASAIVKPAESE